MTDPKELFAHWRGLDSEVRFYATATFFVAVFIFSWWRDHDGAFGWRRNRLTKRREPPIGKPNLLVRPFRRFREPLDIGGVTVDFYEQHLDILAMSGGFKTTLMANLVRQRLKAGRPVVVITGGESPALEAEIAGWGGWIIRPREFPVQFNAFDGDKLFVAQGWAELLPTSSEIKVFQSAFELAVLDYLDSRSDYRVPCTKSCPGCTPDSEALHNGLRKFILAWEPPDSEALPKARVKGMKESYGVRMALLERVFGDWLGQELSVADAIARGIPLMFVLDASTDPDFNRFSTVLVWWGVLNAVQKVGSFDVFMDELARLGLSPKLLAEQIRTFRVADVHFVGGTHASEDLKGPMSDLIQLHAFGRMSSTAGNTRAHAQGATYNAVPAANFGRHNLRRGEFVVVDHEDRVQLGRIPIYKGLPNPRTPRSPRILPTFRTSGMNGGKGSGYAATFKGSSAGAGLRAVSQSENGRTAQGIVEIREEKKKIDVYGPPELPRWVAGPKLERKLEIFCYFKSTPLVGCWLTNHALKGKGKRPGCEYRGQNWNVSDLVLALDDCAAMGLDEAGEVSYLTLVKMKLADRSVDGLSVQHQCENRECVRRDDLEWMSKGANIDDFWENWRARRAAAVA